MPIQVVILAAGKGKRMYSQIPKILHPLAGKPLLEHVLLTAQLIAKNSHPIVVYGHEGEKVKKTLSTYPVQWVEQKEQLGTGHAVMQALSLLNDTDNVLVLYGDVPLISASSLENLIAHTPKKAIGILTANLANPTGYGRIKRNQDQQVVGIVEEKDATEAERALHEINSGIYFIPVSYLKNWLPQLKNNNVQGEHYLTDIIHFAVKENIPIVTMQPQREEEVVGVNDREQLAHLERCYQKQYAKKLLQAGVTIYDPARLDIRGDVQIGRDVCIDVNVILEGKVSIGNNCIIGAHSILRNAVIKDDVEIKPYTMIDGAEISSGCKVGPFARIRPETVLQEAVHVGNFVEIKKSKVGKQSKVNHLSYVGDSEIGQKVNIGAGTITCNYDGVNKHKTFIGDDAFIGSCTQLVAPVTVGEGATIGAGSTITRDAPPHKLTIARTPQRTVDHWERPDKLPLENENQKR